MGNEEQGTEFIAGSASPVWLLGSSKGTENELDICCLRLKAVFGGL
ncbi:MULTISPECIES: hypothetical protein [unclassified Tolypothrix]|nr:MULTISPECIES: hypothetical protein [unclassified Tolypothrix]UYD32985.1 hypothetical protein HG267_28995 [Tolypothrix sp. PCC 7601]